MKPWRKIVGCGMCNTDKVVAVDLDLLLFHCFNCGFSGRLSETFIQNPIGLGFDHVESDDDPDDQNPTNGHLVKERK
jgi:hypothetical protein